MHDSDRVIFRDRRKSVHPQRSSAVPVSGEGAKERPQFRRLAAARNPNGLSSLRSGNVRIGECFFRDRRKHFCKKSDRSRTAPFPLKSRPVRAEAELSFPRMFIFMRGRCPRSTIGMAVSVQSYEHKPIMKHTYIKVSFHTYLL